MFDFKSVIDQVAQASKTPLTFVDDKKVRTTLETLVDTNVNFAKTVYNTNLELTKQLVESTTKQDFSKQFNEFFKVAK